VGKVFFHRWKWWVLWHAMHFRFLGRCAINQYVLHRRVLPRTKDTQHVSLNILKKHRSCLCGVCGVMEIYLSNFKAGIENELGQIGQATWIFIHYCAPCIGNMITKAPTSECQRTMKGSIVHLLISTLTPCLLFDIMVDQRCASMRNAFQSFSFPKTPRRVQIGPTRGFLD